MWWWGVVALLTWMLPNLPCCQISGPVRSHADWIAWPHKLDVVQEAGPVH